jgi:hypothetical protein
VRVDFEYIKDFLELVLNNEKLDFWLNQEQFKPLWADSGSKEKMVFHLEVLEDLGVVESVSNKTHGIGFQRVGHNQVKLIFIPLRLTAMGHQFAADLVKPGVFEKLVSNFKDAGPKEAIKVVFDLGRRILDKKLADLT